MSDCPGGALTLSGGEKTVEELFSAVQQDQPFYGGTGGLTLSGGEPFAQAEEAVRLLAMCKAAGIGTAAETCGFFDPDILSRVAPVCDLFLWDWKISDPVLHRKWTGKSNEVIEKNLLTAAALGAHIRLRCILLNGVNTFEEHYEKIAGLAASIPNLDGVEFLPYHRYGGAKAEELGQKDPTADRFIPPKETLLNAEKAVRNRLPSVRIYREGLRS